MRCCCIGMDDKLYYASFFSLYRKKAKQLRKKIKKMKKQLSTLLLIVGLIIPAQTTQSVSCNLGITIDITAKYIVGAAALTYLSGNIYARLVERATHYRFDNEINILQYIDPSDSVIQEILQKHNKNVSKGFFTRLCERIQLLPISAVEEDLAVFPLLQHRRDLDSYSSSLWWSQWWTVFTQKYDDLTALRVYLQQLKNIVISDYRYTQELQRINQYS